MAIKDIAQVLNDEAAAYQLPESIRWPAGPVWPHCQSTDVTRRISRVAIAQPARDLSNLSSNEMLSVLDGGNSREVGKMFQQVADSTGENLGESFNEATRRLTKGESIDKVERDLAAGGSTSSTSDE